MGGKNCKCAEEASDPETQEKTDDYRKNPYTEQSYRMEGDPQVLEDDPDQKDQISPVQTTTTQNPTASSELVQNPTAQTGGNVIASVLHGNVFHGPVHIHSGAESQHEGGSAGTATPNPNPEKTLLGHCKENLCAGAEGFVPEMIEHKKKNLHSVQCPHDGQFQCRLTNLVFDMKGKGEVRYRIDSWDTNVLDRLGQMKPAGPLYDIDCFERSIDYLYLPHCEILTENQAELAVAHFTNGNLEIIKPLKVTNTHVIIAIEDLSLFGLISKKRSAGPIDAQVLFFYRPVAEMQNLREMHIHLLPGNVPLTEVKNQYSDFANVTTSSNCELTPGRKYSLSCDTLIPQPQVVTFKRNYGPNYYPSFVVFVETVSVTVSLLDESGIQVWEPRLIFLTGCPAPQAPVQNVPPPQGPAVTPGASAAGYVMPKTSGTLIPSSEQFKQDIISKKGQDIYPVFERKGRKRLALMINNVEFEEKRLGAEIDEKNMEKLLKALGYDVVKYNDLTAKEMDEAIKSFAGRDEHAKSDSTFVVIMSHGKRDKIFGIRPDNSDDFLPVDNIFNHLNTANCPALHNKPKVILIQACRRGNYVRDFPDSESDDMEVDDASEHKEKDFVLLFSCTPDNGSYRNKEHGSYLIGFLVEVFNENAHKEHIEELFRLVMKRFENFMRITQMACKERTSLCKLFYLFPGL